MSNKYGANSFAQRFGRWLAVVVVAVGLLAGTLGVAHAATQYTVQPGDTLSGIAARYGVSVDAIVAANNLPNRSTIYAGQTLTIPEAGTPAANNPPPAATGGTYTVQPNDSLTSVAARFGITRQALADANGISASSYLYVGQVLVIPGAGAQAPAKPTNTPQPPPPPTATSVPPTAVPTTTAAPVTAPSQADAGKPVKYTVQPGDNLSKIAAQFNTTVANLQRLNNLGNTNYIYAGQVLIIVAGDDQNNEQPAPTPTTKPEPTPPMGKYGPKWFDVDISDQAITAYEGDTPVYTARVSTGTWKHPTVEGTYRVYAKYVTTKMEGGQGTDEYYNIPNVPYTMYFYGSYALHGAFWHNNFGNPMSHGCVNLPVDVAKWMFEWAPIGTMVVTHQ